MADWQSISALATGGGTLVLAVATFASVRSANRTARIAERSLLAAQRPVLMPSRDTDPVEHVAFGDGHALVLQGGGAVFHEDDGRIYMAISIRNVGTAVAVIRGWHLRSRDDARSDHADEADFTDQARDLYIAPGDTGFWQAAIRDEDDARRDLVRSMMTGSNRILVELMYGDIEDTRVAVSRFSVNSAEDDGFTVGVIRHWLL